MITCVPTTLAGYLNITGTDTDDGPLQVRTSAATAALSPDASQHSSTPETNHELEKSVWTCFFLFAKTHSVLSSSVSRARPFESSQLLSRQWSAHIDSCVRSRTKSLNAEAEVQPRPERGSRSRKSLLHNTRVTRRAQIIINDWTQSQHSLVTLAAVWPVWKQGRRDLRTVSSPRPSGY